MIENTDFNISVGKVISLVPLQIGKATELGEQYKHFAINPYAIHSIGVDIGFGSSNTAVVGAGIIPEQAKNMKVIPVNFSTEHKTMLSSLAMMISKEYIAITKEFDRLIISIRTAYSTEL